MEEYTVQITPNALNDLEEMHRYIAKDLRSPETADLQYDRITDAILSLNTLPGRCKIVDFEPEHSAGLHRMLVGNYSVFYVVRERFVIVTNVLYSASDIEQRLKER